MYIRIWYCFLWNIFLNVYTINCARKTIVITDRIEICHIGRDSPYALHHFQWSRLPNNNFVVDLWAEIFVDIYPKDLGILFKLTRCASKEALDSCEKFTDFVPPINACKFIMMNTFGFRQMMDSFTPPVRCPILKSNYTTHNLTYNIADYNIIHGSDYFWKVEAHVLYRRKLAGILCFDFLFKTINASKKIN